MVHHLVDHLLIEFDFVKLIEYQVVEVFGLGVLRGVKRLQMTVADPAGERASCVLELRCCSSIVANALLIRVVCALLVILLQCFAIPESENAVLELHVLQQIVVILGGFASRFVRISGPVQCSMKVNVLLNIVHSFAALVIALVEEKGILAPPVIDLHLGLLGQLNELDLLLS